MKTILLLFAALFSLSNCTETRRIPKKPFYVVSVEARDSDYRIFYIDADSAQFYFDIDWLDHGQYKPGDIIK